MKDVRKHNPGRYRDVQETEVPVYCDGAKREIKVIQCVRHAENNEFDECHTSCYRFQERKKFLEENVQPVEIEFQYEDEPKMSRTEILDAVVDKIAELGISKRKACKEMGADPQYFYTIVNGKKKPGKHLARRLEDWLDGKANEPKPLEDDVQEYEKEVWVLEGLGAVTVKWPKNMDEIVDREFYQWLDTVMIKLITAAKKEG
jgi:hypothetical protein